MKVSIDSKLAVDAEKLINKQDNTKLVLLVRSSSHDSFLNKITRKGGLFDFQRTPGLGIKMKKDLGNIAKAQQVIELHNLENHILKYRFISHKKLD